MSRFKVAILSVVLVAAALAAAILFRVESTPAGSRPGGGGSAGHTPAVLAPPPEKKPGQGEGAEKSPRPFEEVPAPPPSSGKSGDPSLPSGTGGSSSAPPPPPSSSSGGSQPPTASVQPGEVPDFSDERRSRAAKTYRFGEWPPSDGEREGVDPDAIRPEGLVRRSIKVDPFRGAARLVFGPPDDDPLAVSISVRVASSSKEARLDLLDRLGMVSKPLRAARDLAVSAGDVGFAGGEGNLGFAALARGNVVASFGIDELGKGGPAAADRALRTLIAAWEQAALAAPRVPAGGEVPAPRATAVTARAAKDDGFPLAVGFDGPRAAHVAVAAEGSDSSVIETPEGPVLYSANGGTVKLRVAAATKYLGSKVVDASVKIDR